MNSASLWNGGLCCLPRATLLGKELVLRDLNGFRRETVSKSHKVLAASLPLPGKLLEEKYPRYITLFPTHIYLIEDVPVNEVRMPLLAGWNGRSTYSMYGREIQRCWMLAWNATDGVIVSTHSQYKHFFSPADRKAAAVSGPLQLERRGRQASYRR